MISKQTQKMLLGGLVGSLTYYADLAISDQSWYPEVLKSRIAPQLPRNDELLTSIAPPVIMYGISKKKPKVADMARGTMMYSAPHLMQRLVVNAVKPSALTVSLKVVTPLQVSAANKIYPQPLPVAPVTLMTPAPVGKYR